MENVDVMKQSAGNFGFDPAWIAQVLAQYGPQVLALVIEAARNGMSVNVIMEILKNFGPAVLQFLLSVLTKKQSLKLSGSGDVVTGDVIEGTDVNGPPIPVDTSILDVIIQQYLPLIMQKYLPTIWAQYGPQIMQFISANLQAILTSFGPQIIQFLETNLQAIFDKFGPQIIQMILQLLLSNIKSGQKQ